jgi:SAM-dependent methyltransferase
VAALDDLRPTGDVLELACGPGTWTAQLLRHADTVTAVDGSPEMLEIASARVTDPRVRFVEADLFSWLPDRRYDVVFFGFWISHVPLERFEAFWSLVSDCVEPDGQVLFVDDAHRTAEELVHGEESELVRRRLIDGRCRQPGCLAVAHGAPARVRHNAPHCAPSAVASSIEDPPASANVTPAANESPQP